MGWRVRAIVLGSAITFALSPATPAVATPTPQLSLASTVATTIFRGDALPIVVISTAKSQGCKLFARAVSARTWTLLRGFSVQANRPVSLTMTTHIWQAGDWRVRATCGSSSVTASVIVREPPLWSRGTIALPGATPDFDPVIQDYVFRADESSQSCSVPVKAHMPGGLRISIDGAPAVDGSVSRNISLLPGQRLRIVVTRADQARNYSLRCLPDDFPRWTATGIGTAQWYVGDLVFDRTFGTYVYALDRYGTPVWWAHEPQGNPVTVRAWTSAELRAIGHPGSYALSWFVDSRPHLDTLDGRRFGFPWVSDRHDLQPSGAGTFYAFQYVWRDCVSLSLECVDMTTYGGTARDTVVDAEIVEIDLQGNVVWRWRSRDHIPIEWSARLLNVGFASAYRDDGSWDLVHINSVEPIGDDILVSMRNIDALLRIDKETGQILWKIGGVPSAESLQILDAQGVPVSEPALGGQHDARVLPDGTITTYDNGSLYDRPPRAIRYRVDEVARTATMLEVVYHEKVVERSPCCGGIRRLPQGHWVGSWGPMPTAGEVDANGSPVLTLAFDALHGPYQFNPVEDGVIPARALRRAMDLAYPRDGASAPPATHLNASDGPRMTVRSMLALAP